MFWPIVLPVQITFWMIVGLLLFVTIFAPLVKQERKVVFAWGTLLGVLAFVPSCVGVMKVVDDYRFGMFTYQDFQSVNDIRVQRFLPESATDITVEQGRSGFRAKFKIAQRTFDEWFDQYWKKYGENSAVPRALSEKPQQLQTDEFKRHFGDLGWPPPADAVEYAGPRAGNGAGFTIWYSESEGVAYQLAGYW